MTGSSAGRSRLAGVLLALACAGCVAPAPPPAIGPGLLPDPKPVVRERLPPLDLRKIQVARVDDAVQAIHGHYVVPLDEQSLLQACWQGMEARAKVAGRNVAPVGAATRADVDRLLAELHDPDPDRVDAAADACIDRMLEHHGAGSLLDTKAMREMRDIAPRGAVGLEIRQAPEGASIVAALPGGPAVAAALAGGDLLVAIDGTSLEGKPLATIRQLLRGPVGSKIVLTVRRQGQQETQRVELTRQVIRQVPLVARLVQPGVAAIVVNEFAESTPRSLRDALVRVRKENDAPLKGVVLDLRLNTGGLLDSTVAFAAAFLPRDVLVADLKGRVDPSNRPLRARPSDYDRMAVDVLSGTPTETRTVPIAVLVGPATASGAEIVAGALRVHGRARLFGARTFGMGTIDTILPLHGGRGAVRLVTANVHLPDGSSFHRTGLDPDQSVPSGATPLAQQRRSLDPSTMPDPDDPALRAALAWLAACT